MDVMDKGGANRADSKSKGNRGYESARANLLASNSRRDFEENVGDVEDGEDSIVVVSAEVEVFFEPSKPCIAWKITC
jgi:hypothetical protein